MSEPTSFDNFWDKYDNKKSRDKCERKWFSLTAKDQQACMDSLPSYIKSTPDRQFRKHPITYLNQKCWNDSIYSKEETPMLTVWNKNKPPNPYDREQYDRTLAIDHMRKKIEAFCKSATPSPIQDMGFIYTNLLTERCGMVVPEAVKQQIEAEVTEEANTPRRNKFEPHVNINIKTECRDRELFWWLSEQKKNNIRVFESI